MPTQCSAPYTSSSSSEHRRWGLYADERGQTLAMTAVFIIVVFAFAAVVMDGGSYLLQRRNMQGSADAAALAGARALASGGSATSVARSYVETQNASDEAQVQSIDTTGGNTITVTVHKDGGGEFLQVLGRESPDISATATAKVRTMGAASGMLPMAFMRGSYTTGTNYEVKFDGTAGGNRGAIAPKNTPPTCNNSNGAADFRNLIKGSAHGGFDACAHAIGSTDVNTEPGNMSGPTRQGFDDRMGGDTDGINDVFEYDADSGRWIVLKPDSPRIAIVPVIENTNGTATWPNGKKAIRILSYILCYVGKTGTAGNPAYTNNGKSVWVTPLKAILPEDWDKPLVDYDPSNASASDAPLVISLTN